MSSEYTCHNLNAILHATTTIIGKGWKRHLSCEGRSQTKSFHLTTAELDRSATHYTWTHYTSLVLAYDHIPKLHSFPKIGMSSFLIGDFSSQTTICMVLKSTFNGRQTKIASFHYALKVSPFLFTQFMGSKIIMFHPSPLQKQTTVSSKSVSTSHFEHI